MAVVAIIAALLLMVALVKQKKQWRAPAILAAVLGIVPVTLIVLSVGNGLSAPAIHDIATDWEQPPEYVAAVAVRSRSDNSLAVDGDVISLQQRAYPDVKPLILAQNPQTVFELAMDLVRNRGWTVMRDDKANGYIEAFDESLLFGFKDDVIIRIQENAQGSRVDMRSASRVGLGDLGVNSRRIAEFLGDLESFAN